MNSSGRKAVSDMIEYVSRAWFPVNVPLFNSIRAKLKNGAYQNDRSGLISDLKGDFALFSFCLRRLKEFVTEADQTQNPIDLLRQVELNTITEMLNIPDEQVSPHSFQFDMKSQAQRMRHTLLSCSAVEAFAQKNSHDSDTAFTCALIRQLGLNLIAWNYPRIYSNALGAMKGADASFAARHLDSNLTRVLGLSPLRLGVRATVGWNRSPDLMSGLGVTLEDLGEEGDDATDGFSSPSGAEIARFCEIGESLARLNDAEHYPGSVQEWNGTLGSIKDILGQKGIAIIKKQLDDNSGGYQLLSPDAFKIDISPERHLKTANAQHSQRLIAENPYLRKCSEDVQQKLRTVYEHMVLGQVSTEAIGLLVSTAIPGAGFSRGCVYLVDQRRMVLVPSLRIGNTSLSRFRPLNCTDAGQLHPAVEALSYSAPLRQENVVVNGELVSHITGTFGNTEKTGVLYLELMPRLLEQDPIVSLTLFKAVRHCLNDCLNLTSAGLTPVAGR